VKNPVLCLSVALLLSGCGSIQGTLQETSLAPASSGQTVPRTQQMMIAAARATLAAGYTHFKFSDVSSVSDASRAVGPLGPRPDTSCVWGTTATNCGEGGQQASQVGLTVTMFHANEPGAAGAFEAKQVLAQYKG
jgi:hypothetical protein